MFLARRPSAAAIDRFLTRSASLPLSYDPVGLARTGGPGFASDELRVELGSGEVVFGRAVAALSAWRQFPQGWTQVFPTGAPLAPGTTVAVLIRHLGFWSLNGARVVYGIGGEGAPTFGFAFGTLPTHAERGEELFEVRLEPRTGVVTYHLRAASRPRSWVARAGYPVVRLLQARFRTQSGRSMLAAAREHR